MIGKRNIYRLLLALAIFPTVYCVEAQTVVTLSLDRTIQLACDSSLQAFRNRNQYMSEYWQYRSYKAARLPSLSLSLTPANYSRYIVQRYNSESNIDIFRAQELFSASGGLHIIQNFDLLGGTFYMETSLEYLRNFGHIQSTQYSTIPIRIGYRQNLIGFNQFKWDKKIEPLKYSRANKELVYNMEEIAETAVGYFFDLALAQEEYRLAVENLASCDTLYAIGEKRFRIASISQSELLTLHLDKVNAQNAVENTRMALKNAMFTLSVFLGMDKNTFITLMIPSLPPYRDISKEIALLYAKENNPKLLTDRHNELEAERDVARLLATSRFNANINASVGFNQVAGTLPAAYSNPMRQDLVTLSVTIPLVDWGVRKGFLNIARNTLEMQRIASRQNEQSIEEQVIMTIDDFNIQQQMAKSATEAFDISVKAYEQTKQQFIIGKSDINSLTLSHSRHQSAARNYIVSLQNCWRSYYRLRKLTLYDFTYEQPIIYLISHGNAYVAVR